jgi:hypothetical protein
MLKFSDDVARILAVRSAAILPRRGNTTIVMSPMYGSALQAEATE